MLLSVALASFFVAILHQRVFKTVFNPVTLFCASISVTLGSACLVDSYSDLNLVHGQFRGDPNAIAIAYGLGVIIFLLPWLPFRKQMMLLGKQEASVTDISNFKAWTFLWSSAALFAAIYIVFALGGIPIVRMIIHGHTIEDHIEALPSLPLGLMSVRLAPATIVSLHLASIFVFNKQYKISFKDIALLLIIIVFVATFQGNRQLILIPLFFVVARLQLSKVTDLRKPLSVCIADVVKGAILSVCFLASFITISILRHPDADDIQWFEIFGYFSWPVFNMSSIVDSGYFNISNTPRFVLSEIIPNRLLDAKNSLELKAVLFEPTSPSSYFAYWFIDFGYLGLSLGVFLLSGVCRLAHQWRTRGEFNMRIYILCLWCCATAGIYSHFITTNFFWIPLALLYFEKCFSGNQRYTISGRSYPS